MSKPKRYELKVISDILEIPEASFDDFLTDLKKWHKAIRATYTLIKTLNDATGETLPDNIITMVFIDDQKHDGKIIIKEAKPHA